MNHLTSIAILGIATIGLLGIIVIGLVAIDQSIMTDEVFGVTGDTSEYTCVISEADENLSLNCLKVK
jgi:hypothetical protein